jgi:hypothetical protein
VALEWDRALNAFNAACVLAQCILAVQRDDTTAEAKRHELADAYTERAFAMLRQSLTKGYRDLAWLKKDNKLDPLRKLPQFDKIVSALEEKLKSEAK